MPPVLPNSSTVHTLRRYFSHDKTKWLTCANEKYPPPRCHYPKPLLCSNRACSRPTLPRPINKHDRHTTLLSLLNTIARWGYSSLVREPTQQTSPPARRYRNRPAFRSTCRQEIKAGMAFGYRLFKPCVDLVLKSYWNTALRDSPEECSQHHARFRCSPDDSRFLGRSNRSGSGPPPGNKAVL